MAIDAQTLIRSILQKDIASIVEEEILSAGAKHVTNEQIQIISDKISDKFKISSDEFQIYVVGSAKLGFSIVEKQKDGIVYPRYREYSAASDVDVAVVSPMLFLGIWKELSVYALKSTGFPSAFRKLGSYLVGGWLRPDHFPYPRVGLLKCDDWWGVFASLSADRRLGYRKVSGGLYYSREQLGQYQQRALRECQEKLTETV